MNCAPADPILGWLSMLRGDAWTLRLPHMHWKRSKETRGRRPNYEDLVDVSRIAGGKLKLEVRAIDLTPVIAASVDIVASGCRPRGVTFMFPMMLRWRCLR